MNPNPSQYDQAYAAAQRKDYDSARSLLADLLKREPNNLNAWLLASHVMKTRAEAIQCLERALQIDPANAHAKQRLASLQEKAPAPAPVTSPFSSERPTAPRELVDRPPAKRPTSRANVPAIDSSAASRSQAPRTQASGPEGRALPSKSNNNMVLIFSGLVAVLCCLGLVGIAIFTPGNNFLNPAAPTPTANELFNVLYQNTNAANAENLAAYMATIHPNSPLYDDTEKALSDIFSQFDLYYQYFNLEVTSLKTNEAEIQYSLLTQKIRGPAFRDNTVSGTITLRPDNGVWKIYNQTVDDVQY